MLLLISFERRGECLIFFPISRPRVELLRPQLLLHRACQLIRKCGMGQEQCKK